jgi:c(7)-type cytochrome triheme protein
VKLRRPTLCASLLLSLLLGAGLVGAVSATEAPPALADISYEKVPMGKVTFSHAKHVGAGIVCGDCHPSPFKNARTEDWPDGEGHKACGACHKAEGRAFDLASGPKCQSCHKP